MHARKILCAMQKSLRPSPLTHLMYAPLAAKWVPEYNMQIKYLKIMGQDASRFEFGCAY